MQKNYDLQKSEEGVRAKKRVTPVESEYHELECPKDGCGGNLRCYQSTTASFGSTRNSQHQHRCTRCNHYELRTDYAYPFVAHFIERHGGKVYVAFTR